jgi:allantoicase
MVMMDEHCLVSFYIDKRYFDGNLCNVMFIDACYLFLGSHDNMIEISIKWHNIFLI